MRKAEKRALGEAKAKREAEERRREGLAAQKADREVERRRKEGEKNEVETISQRHARTLRQNGIDPATGYPFVSEKVMDSLTGTTITKNQKQRAMLLYRGIDPSTGEAFTDEEMSVMKTRITTRASKNMFERIQAGRALLLNEQPSSGDISDYLDTITVGDFKDMVDAFYTKSQERMRRETMTNPERAHEFAKALMIDGHFDQAGKSLDEMSASVKDTM